MSDQSADTLFHLALGHHQAGRLTDAESTYRQILALDPNHADANHLLGLIALHAGGAQAALTLVQKAIARNPRAAIYQNSLSQILEKLERFDQAEAACRTALRLDPNYAEAYNNSGNLLFRRAQIVPAISSYQEALRLNPNLASAHTNLGNALLQQGNLGAALPALHRAVALAPGVASYHSNLGNLLAKQQQFARAVELYRTAVHLDPNYADAHFNLGHVYKEQGKLDLAIASFRRAVDLRRDAAHFHSSLLHAMHYHSAIGPAEIAAEHVRWADRHTQPLRTLLRPHPNARQPDRKLRIGYVSPDLRDHAVARFLLPWLQRHQKDSYEFYAYAAVPRPDAVTESIKGLFDVWHPIGAMTDLEVADLVRQDKIDILVDLAGHTWNNRLLIFAHKPAPVQVAWLGYPNTTGLDTMDYRLTDALADPPDSMVRSPGEQLFRLPHGAWCFEPGIVPAPVPRSPARPLIFGSFNNFVKISLPMLRLWAQILTATAGSQLLIKTPLRVEEEIQDGIKRLFQEAGVAPGRVLFRGPENERSGHLNLFHEVDIVLDTFPYHGTTTTCEALWMGRPVVCLVGSSHVSRVGLSLLASVGLPELAATNEADYVRIAVALARDRSRLGALHATLPAQVEASPLMDAARFARDVETAFRTMWHTWCQQPM